LNHLIAWINFISMLASLILFAYFYILSIQPVGRKAKRGEKAWKECEDFRKIASIFEFVSVTNAILWLWFPIPEMSWKISPNYWIGISIALIITIPCLLIEIKGIMDAGSETMKPSPKTKLFGGIYKYIRHPQSLGEFPLYVAISFALNSWFLVIITLIYILIYLPIMVHFEEQDLIKRFGDAYREYQKRTGALFPKFGLKRK